MHGARAAEPPDGLARVPAGARTLKDALLARARTHPDRAYVRCLSPGGEHTLTYRALVERGGALAGGLAAQGVPPRGIVLIVLPHSTDLYAAFFGPLLAGMVPSILAVPSFKLDAARYRAELHALAAHIDAAALVTDAATERQLGLEQGMLGQTRIVVLERLAPAPPPPDDVPASEDDVALLQHSSGSTGLKKGVALSHRAVLGQIEAYAPALSLRADDHIASWLPLYHDMGLIACAVMPAVCGVPVTALSPLHWVTRPASLLHAIDRGAARCAGCRTSPTSSWPAASGPRSCAGFRSPRCADGSTAPSRRWPRRTDGSSSVSRPPAWARTRSGPATPPRRPRSRSRSRPRPRRRGSSVSSARRSWSGARRSRPPRPTRWR
jgi:acyl-CoA synthetase (AMP-forming)/AMP-acid ligase II